MDHAATTLAAEAMKLLETWREVRVSVSLEETMRRQIERETAKELADISAVLLRLGYRDAVLSHEVRDAIRYVIGTIGGDK